MALLANTFQTFCNWLLMGCRCPAGLVAPAFVSCIRRAVRNGQVASQGGSALASSLILRSSSPRDYVTLPAVWPWVPLQCLYIYLKPSWPFGELLISFSSLCFRNESLHSLVLQVKFAVAAYQSFKDKGYSEKLLAVGSRVEELGTESSKPAEMSLVTVQTLITRKLHSSPMKDQWVIGVPLYPTGCTEQIKAEGVT